MMKKILLKGFAINILLCVFLLFGCNNKDNEDNFQETTFDSNELIQNAFEVKNGDPIGAMDLYGISHRNPIEGSISKDSRILCGYLDNETIQKISNKYLLPYMGFYVHPISYDDMHRNIFESYQQAYEQHEINLEEDKLYFYTFEDEIPYTYENHTLVVVIEVIELELKDGQIIYMYASTGGELKDGFYHLAQETRLDRYKGKKFVYTAQFFTKEKYLYVLSFDLRSLLVNNIDNQEVLSVRIHNPYDPYDPDGPHLEMWTKYENFLNLIKPAFIKEENKLDGYYDYNMLKTILNIQ